MAQIRQALAELELVSHAPVRNYEGRSAPSADEDIGGRRPSGGDSEFPASDEVAAFRESYQAKTVGYFRRELARRGPGDALLAEIEAVVRAWRHSPLPAGDEPAYGTTQWKIWVTRSAEPAKDLADRFNCTARYIREVRQAMREGGLMPLDKVGEREDVVPSGRGSSV